MGRLGSIKEKGRLEKIELNVLVKELFDIVEQVVTKARPATNNLSRDFRSGLIDIDLA